MRFTCILFFILSSFSSFGQHASDSVAALVTKTNETSEKIGILNKASASLADADLKKSFAYASQALELATRSGDDIGLANAYLNLGKYYARLGLHDKAMENCMKALEISEQQSDQKLKGTTYKIIGNNFYFKGNFGMALEYYERALAVNLEVKDEETAADLQNNIALVYISSNKIDSALEYLEMAIATYTKLNKPAKLSNALLNMGLAKDRLKLHQEAIDFYKRALELNRTRGLTLQEGVALNNIGSSLIQQKAYKEAVPYVAEARVIGERENFKTLLLNVYENLYLLAKVRGDFPEALAYHEKLIGVKDSITGEQQTRQIEELRINHELVSKEREVQSLLLESSLQQQQLSFTRLLLFFIGLLAVVATVLAFSYYRSLIQFRKAKSELTVLNRQIHDQKEEITETAKKLSRANDEIASINENLQALVEDKTSKIVEQNTRLVEYTFHNSHRVRGPITRILGLINLVRLGALEPGEMEYVLNKIQSSSEELDSVIKEINQSLNNTLSKTENES